uniref:RING-type domain-containing protein n=1 Tax=Dunaliella tertiolecta TaxID=3047 RepID=A0A7S3R773_DUNTE
MQLEETFRGTVAHAQRRIQELKEKHFLEPAGADFCEGQVLKVSHTTLHPHHLKTFHCYEPTCQQRCRHHKVVNAECKPHPDGSTWKKSSDYDKIRLELTLPGRDPRNFSKKTRGDLLSREQILVSEICEAFGQPLLRPLHEPWQCDKRDRDTFKMLFDHTAQSLARFLKDEMQHLDSMEPPLLVEQNPMLKDQMTNFWLELEPQVKDTIRVLWQGDLNAEGVYLNIAMHIRRLSSRLLMHAMGKCLAGSGAPAKDILQAAQLRSAGNKASYLVKSDPTLEPFADLCEVLDRLASAIIHKADAADFELASKNTGNTTIIICRGIVLACAMYMDWYGWSDLPQTGRVQVPSKEFVHELRQKFALSSNIIESCSICYEKPLTHGFLHGDAVHWCACESCGFRCAKAKKSLCPACNLPIDKVVNVYMSGYREDDDGGSAGPSSAQAPVIRAGARQEVQVGC